MVRAREPLDQNFADRRLNQTIFLKLLPEREADTEPQGGYHFCSRTIVCSQGASSFKRLMLLVPYIIIIHTVSIQYTV